MLVLIATTLGFVAIAVVGEAAVRYRERHRLTVPGTMPLLFYQHRRLRHAFVRNSDYFQWVHINRQGFRGPDVLDKGGRFRIIVVGSSTTFDGGVSRDDRTWPARLQFWLQELDPAHPVEVINAGIPGYGVLDDLIRLDTDLSRLQPDLLILYEGHNDLFGALGAWRKGWQPDPYTPDEIPVVTPWGHWLSRHSLLYAKVVGRLQIMRFAASGRGRAQAPPPKQLIDSGAHQFRRNVRSFLAVAQGMGIPVVVAEIVQVSGPAAVSEPDSVIRAMWWRAVPFAAPEAVLRGYQRYNAVLHDVAQQPSARFVPTANFGLAGPEWYAEGDPIHFNDRGADRMGQRMAEALRKLGAVYH